MVDPPTSAALGDEGLSVAVPAAAPAVALAAALGVAIAAICLGVCGILNEGGDPEAPETAPSPFSRDSAIKAAGALLLLLLLLFLHLLLPFLLLLLRGPGSPLGLCSLCCSWDISVHINPDEWRKSPAFDGC